MTEAGLRTNISVGVQYLEAWLRGIGAVAINNLMEDTATAEICRAQVWQWLHHPDAKFEHGRRISIDEYQEIAAEEVERIRQTVGDKAFFAGRFDAARDLFDRLVLDEEFQDFLTLPALDLLEQNTGVRG